MSWDVDTKIESAYLHILIRHFDDYSLSSRYVFDQVFGMGAEQEEVFTKTAKPLLPGVLDGYNATVFAYGVGFRCILITKAHLGCSGYRLW